MSQPPTPYDRSYSFRAWSISNPNDPHQGQQIDQQLDNAGLSLNQTITRLNEIQADDGKIRLSSLPEAISGSVEAAQDAVEAAEAAAAQAEAAAASAAGQMQTHTNTFNHANIPTTIEKAALTAAATAGASGTNRLATIQDVEDSGGVDQTVVDQAIQTHLGTYDHTRIPSINEKAALTAAATAGASGTNRLATMLDLTSSGSLTTDQSNAIIGASSPSASNVFVTQNVLNTSVTTNVTNNTGIAKAWVSFNGKIAGTTPPGTVLIRCSRNVSSVTDMMTGTFIINFSGGITYSRQNFCVSVSCGNAGAVNNEFVNVIDTGNSCFIETRAGTSLFDHDVVNVVLHGI